MQLSPGEKALQATLQGEPMTAAPRESDSVAEYAFVGYEAFPMWVEEPHAKPILGIDYSPP